MTYTRREKNGWALFLLILAGIVIGGFLGALGKDVPFLEWLNFGYGFGFDDPVKLNLQILLIEFKFFIRITIASILGIAVAIFIYRRL